MEHNREMNPWQHLPEGEKVLFASSQTGRAWSRHLRSKETMAAALALSSCAPGGSRESTVAYTAQAQLANELASELEALAR